MNSAGRTLTVVGLVLLRLGTSPAATGTQDEDLYACAATPPVDAGSVGVAVCDAAPTPMLTEQAEVNNWQVRAGALVVDLDASGVSVSAGLEPGDMIYRVGGMDVTDARAAVALLAEVGPTSDTVVNFLRRGRPYRVKLRTN